MSETQINPTLPNPETTEQPVAPLSPADIFPTPSPAFGGHDVAAVLAHKQLVRHLPGLMNNSRAGLDLAPQSETPRESPVIGKHAAETILADNRSTFRRLGSVALSKLFRRPR